MTDWIKQELERQKAVSAALGLDAPARLATAGLFGTEQRVLQELSEVKRLHDLASALPTAAQSSISAAVSADTSGRSIGQMLKQQEVIDRQTMIANLLSAIDPAAMRALAASAVSSVADPIYAGITEAKRSLDAVTIKDQLASTLAGINAGLATSMEDRIGVLSLKSVAALALEERAGIAAMLNTPAVNPAFTAISGNIFEDVRKGVAADSLATLIDQVKAADHFSAQMFADATSTAALAQRMQAMTMPWLSVADEVRSATAFSRLQAVGEILSHAAPYASAVGSILRAGGLGDWREDVNFEHRELTVDGRNQVYVAQGADIQLVEQETKIFVPSAAIAGLFDEDENWDATWNAVAEDSEQLATLAFQRLRKLERLLRAFISAALEARFGPKWTRQRLPNGMLDECVARQEKARGGADYSDDVTDFMDFTDYGRIIDKTDNWRDVFQHVFGRREEIKESLQRLQPLRLATMHARSVSTFDLLVLLVESRRVVVAIQHWNARQSTSLQ